MIFGGTAGIKGTRHGERCNRHGMQVAHCQAGEPKPQREACHRTRSYRMPLRVSFCAVPLTCTTVAGNGIGFFPTKAFFRACRNGLAETLTTAMFTGLGD